MRRIQAITAAPPAESVDASGEHLLEFEAIPILRPLLPAADEILPFLRRIDARRIYSNWGPLVAEFEQTIGGFLGVQGADVAVGCSGTAVLTGAILASAGRATPARPLALLPAFTFVGTVAAVEACGFTPYLIDVDPETWLLDAESLASHKRLGEAGVVIPVAAFGKVIPQQAWQDFSDRTGIPVIIDAAASLDLAMDQREKAVGPIPQVFSFHATKAFGVGEGGAVVSTNPSLLARTRQALNFGFSGSRDSKMPSLNGKMSEYHAAVGLAEAAHWEAKAAAIRAVLAVYRSKLAGSEIERMFLGYPEIGLSYALFVAKTRVQSERALSALERAAIGCRSWYSAGLHHHTYYRDVARDPLPVTDTLAPLVIGIPLMPDMPSSQIGLVVNILSSAVGKNPDH